MNRTTSLIYSSWECEALSNPISTAHSETAGQPQSIPSATPRDMTPATKHDVDMMITERLMQFHDALIGRGQIQPIPPDAGPKVDKTQN